MNTSLAAHRLSQDELDELHRVAHGAYLAGRYDEAVRYFWFISLHAPTDVRYLKGMGAGLFMARAFSEASVAYSYLLQIAPMDPEVHCMLGHALLMLGQGEQARKHLEHAVQLPGSEAGLDTRARALLELLGD
jgi:Flp pilus assembly protein TadD